MGTETGRFFSVAVVGAVLCILCAGCDRDVRLAGRKLRDVKVRTVTHYGITLDQQASPEEVAYVLLRAIRDDFHAKDPAGREAALDKQFDVCAASAVHARGDAGISKQEVVFSLVHQWTPTVSHYVNDFETEWEKAKARFVLAGPRPVRGSDSGVMECQVLLEAGDPSDDPNAGAVIVVSLIQDGGYWRAARIGFLPRRAIKSRSASAVRPENATSTPGQ